MFSHTTLGVADADRARTFYGPLLAALGLVPKFADARWAGWKHPDADRPLFIVTRPFDGAPASSGNGQMTAFLAPSRALVDRCHTLALDHGGTDEGAPGLRSEYHPHYYGAYVRDPDGNKLCICCHDPE
jgi:catechol 2,3-dioxygenase-like lactoylglutathione lyase family enzyme